MSSRARVRVTLRFGLSTHSYLAVIPAAMLFLASVPAGHYGTGGGSRSTNTGT